MMCLGNGFHQPSCNTTLSEIQIRAYMQESDEHNLCFAQPLCVVCNVECHTIVVPVLILHVVSYYRRTGTNTTCTAYDQVQGRLLLNAAVPKKK